MAVFEDLLPICTAPIQAFFCNLFPILLLLWRSHQNFSLDVDYSTPEILQYLLLSLHFSLSSPNHICPALGRHPSNHAHAHTPFGSLLGPPLLFTSYSKLLVLPFMVLQTNILWHLFLLLHTASICYQCFISSPFPPMSFMQNSENSSSQRKI